MSLGVAYGQGYFLARPAPLSLLGLTHSDAATSGAAA
jgi:EAL domain-containing protein (putative c-di-GMP-specific phosphodiesterase class I)